MFVMIIIKVVNKGLVFLAFLLLLVLSCTAEDPEVSRERGIRQREQNKATVRTTENQEVYGRYSSSDYDGPSCNSAEGNKREINGEDCEDICDKLFDQESRRCEKLAVELIKKLNELFEDLSRVGHDENLSRSVKTFDFGVMIDIHVQPVLTLIEEWNVRETAVFLIWVAQTSAVTLALLEHDTEHEILESAFKKVSAGTVEDGLSKDLKGYSKTFWALARAEQNKSAFIVIHNLLKKICSNKECKMKNYCIREEFENNFRQRAVCAYSGNRRIARRVEHCYIHGPDVWNYWINLNREGEFDDSEFPKDIKMNEEECDKLCMTVSCGRN